MQVTHFLKISPVYFEQVESGNKTFEIRQNDRDYREADIVVLSEYDESKKDGTLKYTGREVRAIVGYVTAYEQTADFVVFSLTHIVASAGDQR